MNNSSPHVGGVVNNCRGIGPVTCERIYRINAARGGSARSACCIRRNNSLAVANSSPRANMKGNNIGNSCSAYRRQLVPITPKGIRNKLPRGSRTSVHLRVLPSHVMRNCFGTRCAASRRRLAPITPKGIWGEPPRGSRTSGLLSVLPFYVKGNSLANSCSAHRRQLILITPKGI